MHIKELFDLTGKTAVVTGGAGLYGRQICEALCEAGARLVFTYADNAGKAAEFLKRLNIQGFEAAYFHLELGSEKSIIDFRNQVIEKFGSTDILINNAVARDGGGFEDTTAEQWEHTSRINSEGLFLICKYFIEQMLKQGSGNIINISSIQGCSGPRFPVYGNTGMSSPAYYTYDKWGMAGMTHYIANYYGKNNIRCNCISPGGYYTSQDSEFVENYCRLTPLGRMGGDDDLKGAVVFLASEASKYVTGQNIPVDGGWTSW